MMDNWWIYLRAWPIEDGNYRDFRVGQEARFALYFRPHVLQPVTVSHPRLERLEEARYRFEGQTVFRGDIVWVLDAGLLMYHEQRSHPIPAPGTGWDGELSLEVDPYYYFEDFARQPGIPPLVYRWRIERLLLDTTPYLEAINEDGSKIYRPDLSRRAAVEVSATEILPPGQRRQIFRMECSWRGDPSWTRHRNAVFDASLKPEQVLGVKTAVILTDQVTPDTITEPIATTATVVQVSPDQYAVLRLAAPLQFPAGWYEYVVASPRYDGEGIGCLATAGQHFCHLFALPAELVQRPETFQWRLWPAGAPHKALLRLLTGTTPQP
jgi:hypothetical protein